ncbi:transcriptional regulator [Burkholderia vietnamiensis]|uniref:helix-turn-helix domain-containing protein n=1 Tax=Burkholderia TaxID=32008 RepID=UPI000756A61D|nr:MULTISPECIES: helix-turn-helix transcriptional regulator [Burkholderia]KVE68441.1 transcriptional regulator [Burkholderia vietnamiensis]MBR8036428.1 helix-turn-helix transcriptional regulator [Burkholderia vietnamiensis]QMI44975.1 helix-turn-helix transcriptional regulator [Burkholderia sp. MBR-1]
MSTEERSIFGLRLKEARLRVGLSQRQLGIDAGLDPFVASTRVNRYELGVHKVDFQFASKLAAVLKVPVAYFYADDPELAELIRTYGALPSRAKTRLLRSARELAGT